MFILCVHVEARKQYSIVAPINRSCVRRAVTTQVACLVCRHDASLASVVTRSDSSLQYGEHGRSLSRWRDSDVSHTSVTSHAITYTCTGRLTLRHSNAAKSSAFFNCLLGISGRCHSKWVIFLGFAQCLRLIGVVSFVSPGPN